MPGCPISGGGGSSGHSAWGHFPEHPCWVLLKMAGVSARKSKGLVGVLPSRWLSLRASHSCSRLARQLRPNLCGQNLAPKPFSCLRYRGQCWSTTGWLGWFQWYATLCFALLPYMKSKTPVPERIQWHVHARGACPLVERPVCYGMYVKLHKGWSACEQTRSLARPWL